jgi:4-amino-4-deoxy-L-arabinose transferase-like glycosyltransferase
MILPSWKSPKYAIYIAVLLVACLVLELSLAGRQQSQTFDEADHILAGYRYWMCSDFSANPEHPPMVKLVASIPLLFQTVRAPIPLCGYADPSTHRDFLDGRAFLYSNDAGSILFRTRLFAGLFTVVLGAVLFGSAYVTFGAGPGLIALAIFVFEPNILAHGFLVTTDMGLTCCLYTAVFAFYLYLKKRTKRRLLLAGVLAGTVLAAKHSGILIFPILLAIAFADLAIGQRRTSEDKQHPMGKRLLSLGVALAFIAVIAYVTLWAFYGLRFAARPGAHVMILPVVDSAGGSLLKPLVAVFAELLRVHFLPESYLYGLKHVLAALHGGGPIFVFGRTYSTGRWFYFPIVFFVKSTLGFLLLLLLATVALFLAPNKNRTALSMLVIPPLLFLAFCFPSNLNIGIRHILPIYPFLIVLAAAGAWELSKYRNARYLAALLIALHVTSSLASFPNYIPYSNEAFGGTKNTYKVLGSSNVDWGQSLKAINSYVRTNGIKDCWIAYLTSADPTYYQTGCKFLPTANAWVSRDDMFGSEVDGTLLIGASELEGTWIVNPYAQFRKMVPAGNISGTVLVFHGRFYLTLAFALSQINLARSLSEEGRSAEAVDAARKAVAVAPNIFPPHAELARALSAVNRIEEARTEYQLAISLARSFHPTADNQRGLAQLEKELRQLQQVLWQ